MPDKIVMLDGYSLMYRAFHALQTPMTAPDGTPTNAVHGFTMMLLKVLDEEKPDGHCRSRSICTRRRCARRNTPNTRVPASRCRMSCARRIR